MTRALVKTLAYSGYILFFCSVSPLSALTPKGAEAEKHYQNAIEYITMASQTSGSTERHFRNRAISELKNTIYLAPRFTAAYHRLGQELELIQRLEEFLPFMNNPESGFSPSERGWVYYKLAMKAYRWRVSEEQLTKVRNYLAKAEDELSRSKIPKDLEYFYLNIRSIPTSIYRPLHDKNRGSAINVATTENAELNILLKLASSLNQKLKLSKPPSPELKEKLLDTYRQVLEIYIDEGHSADSITELLDAMAEFPGSLVHVVEKLNKLRRWKLRYEAFLPPHIVSYAVHLFHENMIDKAYDLLFKRFLYVDNVSVSHLKYVKNFFEGLQFTKVNGGSIASELSLSELWATEFKVQAVNIVERVALRNPKVFQVGNVYGPPWPSARKRILINFDTSNMPPSQQITTLRLFFYEAGGDSSYNLVLHPLTSAWTPSEATWLFRNKQNKWRSPGGDFDDRLSIKPMLRADRLECDLTDILKARLKAHQNIFGFILRATNEADGTPKHPQYAHFHKEERKLYPRLMVVSKSRKKPAANSLRYVEGSWNQTYAEGLRQLMMGDLEATLVYWRWAADGAPGSGIREEILEHISAVNQKM